MTRQDKIIIPTHHDDAVDDDDDNDDDEDDDDDDDDDADDDEDVYAVHETAPPQTITMPPQLMDAEEGMKD